VVAALNECGAVVLGVGGVQLDAEVGLEALALAVGGL